MTNETIFFIFGMLMGTMNGIVLGREWMIRNFQKEMQKRKENQK